MVGEDDLLSEPHDLLSEPSELLSEPHEVLSEPASPVRAHEPLVAAGDPINRFCNPIVLRGEHGNGNYPAHGASLVGRGPAGAHRARAAG